LVHSRLDYGNSVLASLPAYLLRQLQSVLNAAARLVYHLRARDHITDALISLHWLRATERILYKMAVLTYKAVHGGSPRYLSLLVHVANVSGRLAPRSAGSNRLRIPPFKLSTIGGPAFPVAAAQFWNRLPDSVSQFVVRILLTYVITYMHTYLHHPSGRLTHVLLACMNGCLQIFRTPIFSYRGVSDPKSLQS